MEAINNDNVVGEQVPEAEEPTFSMKADGNGITKLTFTKNAGFIGSILLNLLAFVNGAFDEPLPTTGDFARMLGEIADQIDEDKNREREAAAVTGEQKAD